MINALNLQWKTERKKDIFEKSFSFALHIISLYKLLNTKREFVISKQILKSGTNIGANVNEASVGESRKDFAHKMSIASKEARETLYWLNLLKESWLLDLDASKKIDECTQLVRMLTSIVKTTQNQSPKTQN